MKRTLSWLFLFLLCQCGFYEDQYVGPLPSTIVVNLDGLVEVEFSEENDSIFYSLSNISGDKLENLDLFLQLFDGTQKQSNKVWELRSTSTLEPGSIAPKSFVHKSIKRLSKESIRLNIIAVDGLGILGDLPGEYKGAFWMVDLAKEDSIGYLMQGCVSYDGSLFFENLGNSEVFSFVEGKLQTNQTYDWNLLKSDRSLTASASSNYTFTTNQLQVLRSEVTDSVGLTLKLTKIIE